MASAVLRTDPLTGLTCIIISNIHSHFYEIPTIIKAHLIDDKNDEFLTMDYSRDISRNLIKTDARKINRIKVDVSWIKISNVTDDDSSQPKIERITDTIDVNKILRTYTRYEEPLRVNLGEALKKHDSIGTIHINHRKGIIYQILPGHKDTLMADDSVWKMRLPFDDDDDDCKRWPILTGWSVEDIEWQVKSILDNLDADASNSVV